MTWIAVGPWAQKNESVAVGANVLPRLP
ncbi:hypothetical protein CCACVL1_26467 [Corchorus capsularis]|uniref:Uncharacterized protein n=1 Tax=Corchorus capsularis TaxID=210143 RepID=A0A1R3GEP0_COCAP|nr:hypothetical protein CCACVL1_26467 [Corchorus capsularis]